MATLDEMELAAQEAWEELQKLDSEVVKVVATWWKQHYLKAGHKRLGRILVSTLGSKHNE